MPTALAGVERLGAALLTIVTLTLTVSPPAAPVDDTLGESQILPEECTNVGPGDQCCAWTAPDVWGEEIVGDCIFWGILHRPPPIGLGDSE